MTAIVDDPMKRERNERPTSGDEVPTNCSVVEVYVRDLNQLLDSMDPSPFHEKDLDRNAEEYIVSSLKELPRRPAALIVYLDKPGGLANEDQVLGEAIRVHFARRSQMLRWELRRLLRRGWISLAIGLTFLAASVIGGEALMRMTEPTALAQILRESLLIGGWVAMWKPLQIFLYDWWPLLGERRVYDRLSRMAVQIVYAGERSSASAASSDGAGRFEFGARQTGAARADSSVDQSSNGRHA